MKTTVLAAVAAMTVAAGAATNGVTSAETIVVEASRIGAETDEMPAAVHVFDAAAIAASGAQDLPELLAKAANVQIRTLNANPLQAQVAMRGFGENSFGRVKVIVDGEELNPADMDAPNLLRVPLDGVERVEVITGPSPVLHGDGAVAGIINVTTDTHDDTRRTKLTAKGGSHGTFGADVRTKGGFEDEGVLYSANGGYLRSDGFRERSGYDVYTTSGTVRKNFANGSTVGVKANYFNALYQMPGALSYAAWQQDRRQAAYRNDWCRLWQYGVAVDSKLKLAEDQWLYVDGAFSFKHRKSHWGDSGYANEYDLYGYQLSPRYVNEKTVFDFDNRFTLGFDFKYDRYEVIDRSGWNNPDYAFDRARYAPYLHDEWFVTEELSLVAGARLEAIDNRWDNYLGLAESHAQDWMDDFELGLVYRPVDGLKTFVKGTRFHRSAFCDELNYTEDGTFLKPETGTSLDLGFDAVFAKEFTFDLDGYWTAMEDEIFYNPHAKDYGGTFGGYNCNSPGRTERLGFDAGLGWRREKVAEASVRYGFVSSRFASGQYEGGRVPLVPESRVRAEAGWWIVPDLELKAGCRFVSSQVLAGDFDNAHERLDAYTLFDLGLHYTPSWAEGWKASFVMDNVLDLDYCDFAGWSDYTGAYYYPAAGRTFLFTLSYAF